DGQAEATGVAVERGPLLDGALAEGALPDERAAARVPDRPGDDLARRRAPPIDEDHELDRLVGRHAATQRLGRDLLAGRVLLPEDRARGDELTGHLARG